MTRLDDRLLDHPVRTSIDTLRRNLDVIPEDAKRQAADVGFDQVVERGLGMCDYVIGLLDSVEPPLVPESTLDDIRARVDQANEPAQRLAADTEAAAQLDLTIERVIEAVTPLAALAPFPPDVAETIGRRLGRAVTSKIKSLEASYDLLQGALTRLNDERARGEETIKEQLTSQKDSLDQLERGVREAIDNQATRLDQLVPQFEDTFNKAERDRADKSNETLTKLTSDVTASRDRASAELGELSAELNKKVAEIYEEVSEKRDEVTRLYGIIADTGTAGAFAKDAHEQKQAADTWRIATIVAGVLTLSLAVGALLLAALRHDVTTATHIGSFIVALTAGGLTAYCARQSGHHRDREGMSRRLEMELTAFGPFVAKLADPDQARRDYAERLFRGSDDHGQEPTLDKDQINLVQGFADTLLKAVK